MTGALGRLDGFTGFVVCIALGGYPDNEEGGTDNEQQSGSTAQLSVHGMCRDNSIDTVSAPVADAQLRRRRTTTNAAMAAAATRRPVAPMTIVDASPSAAMAPRTPRIDPMQHATQAATPKPMTSTATHAARPNNSATMSAAPSGARTSNPVPRWSR
jgi:hypothetical protein